MSVKEESGKNVFGKGGIKVTKKTLTKIKPLLYNGKRQTDTERENRFGMEVQSGTL